MRLQIVAGFSVPVFYLLLLFMSQCADEVVTQEPLFELPVQLIGFPVIMLSVRLSQFAKKLAYSLNPSTYKERSKRDTSDIFASRVMDIRVAEKEIIKEFGPKACILEEPCKIHAARQSIPGEQPNWADIMKNYKVQSTGMKQWYLLSVFLGDVIRDVPLCKQLAKHLNCGRGEEQFTGN